MARGFIKLDRGLMDHWLWEDKPFDRARAWVDLLMLANHASTKAPYKGEIVTFERGTVNRSITWLAERWGWSRKRVRSFLKLLEQDGMVTVKGTSKGTTITLCNYNVYQTQRASQGTNKGTNEGTSQGTNQGTTYKNDKNDKNEKNITPPLPPSRGGRKKMRRLDDGSDDGDDYTAMLRKQLEEEMF